MLLNQLIIIIIPFFLKLLGCLVGMAGFVLRRNGDRMRSGRQVDYSLSFRVCFSALYGFKLFVINFVGDLRVFQRRIILVGYMNEQPVSPMGAGRGRGIIVGP